METVFFWTSSIIAVLSALGVLFVKRPTRALLSLLLCMVCLSILYTLLNAYFVAIVHLIVYAGAVMVLFLFVVMLEGLGAATLPIHKRFPLPHLILTSLTGIAFCALLVKIFSSSNFSALQNSAGTVENIGRNLFSNYLLPVELVAVLILIGIFAASSLVKPPKEKA